MGWNLVAPNTWSNNRSPYIIKYDDTLSEFIVENINGENFIPLSDIFNNPAFPLDLSNSDVLVKSLQSSGIVTGTHLRSEALNTPATPGHSFKAEINSGFFRESPGVLAFSILGNVVGRIGAGYGGFTGNIIQVVNSENDYTHTILTTANWNSDLLSGVGTSWEISITPKYSNSKIILNALINGYVSHPSSSAYFGISIWRKIGAGAYSQIYIPMTDTTSSYENGISAGSSIGLYGSFPRLYVDLPNTTSQINYKFSIRVYTGSTFYHSVLPASGTKSKSFCVLQEVQQ